MSVNLVDTGSLTARRLAELARLYEQGQVSTLTERAIAKIWDHEATLARTQLEVLEADLIEFEQHYEMTSDEFYQRFRSGETDDRMDFVEWASLVQMARNLYRRLRLFTEEMAT